MASKFVNCDEYAICTKPVSETEMIVRKRKKKYHEIFEYNENHRYAPALFVFPDSNGYGGYFLRFGWDERTKYSGPYPATIPTRIETILANNNEAVPFYFGKDTNCQIHYKNAKKPVEFVILLHHPRFALATLVNFSNAVTIYEKHLRIDEEFVFTAQQTIFTYKMRVYSFSMFVPVMKKQQF
uniref:Uncharacterized protein n=1 Tax=viral metagenome TaxID=1070528 RepID=A0A6C0IWZ3_9ZZZZ